MTRRIVVLALLLATSAFAAPVPKTLKAKRPNLDGEWVAVEMKVGSQDVLENNGWVWKIRGEQLEAIERRRNAAERPVTPGATFSLVANPGDGPNEIQYCCRGPGYDITSPALIDAGSDEFAFCWSNDNRTRPTAVKPAEGFTFVRFKRVEK